MTQRLHLVFGGELVDPEGTEFRDPDALHLVGLFTDYDSAYDAWKSEAQRTVDNAHMRYFISPVDPMSAEAMKAAASTRA